MLLAQQKHFEPELWGLKYSPDFATCLNTGILNIRQFLQMKTTVRLMHNRHSNAVTYNNP